MRTGGLGGGDDGYTYNQKLIADGSLAVSRRSERGYHDKGRSSWTRVEGRERTLNCGHERHEDTQASLRRRRIEMSASSNDTFLFTSESVGEGHPGEFKTTS